MAIKLMIGLWSFTIFLGACHHILVLRSCNCHYSCPHSQCHEEGDGEDKLEIGEVIEIVGQHACLILAAYPWYYVVDSEGEGRGKIVEDIWVPWKGW